MKRIVEPELLDELPPDDASAVRSRGDLQRLNELMRHVSLFHDTLSIQLKQPPQVIAEIGAGDGTLMLKLAGQLRAHWPNVRVVLVDRHKVVADATLKSFDELGWQAEVATADVFEWIESAGQPDVVLANLFLHHFQDERLASLFRGLAGRTDFFLACETRRNWQSLFVGRFLGLIGCNSVTRHDAVISMRAGFEGNELSALWPKQDGWKLSEYPATVFTHLFLARRKG